MKIVEFEVFKRKFISATDDEKIVLYVETENLTKDEYEQLLKIFPLSKLGALENALK